MAEDRIDSIIDTVAITAEIKALYGNLDDLASKLKSFPVAQVGTGDLSKLTSQYQAQQKAIDALKASNDKLNKSLLDAVKAQKEAEQTAKKTVQTQKEREKAAKEEAKANEYLINDYKQLSQAYTEAALRAKNYSLQLGASSPVTKAAVADAKALGDKLYALDASVGQYQRNVGNYSSAFTGFANTLRGLRGPTKLLGEALGIGAQEADQFRLVIEHAAQGIAAFFRGKEAKVAAEGADAAATGAAATANTAYTTTVATGTAATNTFVVSTEASTVALEAEAVAVATVSTGMKVLRGLLLGLGIAAFVGAIAYLIYKVVDLGNAFDVSKEKQKDLTEAMKDASGEYQKAVKEVAELTEYVKLAKEGFLDKDEVLKKYNESIGKTTGQVKSLDEAEQALTKNGQAYIEMTLYKAAANIALTKAADFAYKAEEARRKQVEEFKKTTVDTRVNAFGSQTFNAAEYDADTKRIEAAQKKRQAAAVALEKKGQQEQVDIANYFQKQAAQIAKDFKFDFFGDNDGKKKGEFAKQLADLIKSQSTEFDIYKLYQKRKIDLLKELLSSDKVYYLDKYELLDQYLQAERELLNRQEAYDIAQAKKETEREVANLNKDKTGKSVAQVARINQNILTLENNLAEKINLIHADTKIKQDVLLEDGLKTRKKINDQQLEVERQFAKQQEELEELTNDNIAKIRKKVAIREYNYQVEKLKETQLLQDRNAEITKIGVQGVEDILFKSLEAQQQRRIDAYNEEKSLIDEKLANEIDGINKSGLAQEEKERRVIAAQKQAAFEKEQIDKKKEASERKLHQVQKAAAFTQIAINTAIAVADIERKAAQATAEAALLASNPVTAAYSGVAAAQAGIILSQIPIVIAGAAVQLAQLSFFKDGTDNAPKGFAIAGEEGHELVTELSGRQYLTPNVPTLMNFKGGEKITPAGLTQDILNAANMKSISSMQTGKGVSMNDVNTHIMNDMLRELRLQNRKGSPVIHNHGAIETTVWYNKHFKA